MTTSLAALSPDAQVGAARAGRFGDNPLLNELLVASGRHDQAAFAQLYQLTSPWIYYLLRRRPVSIAQAEDELVRIYTAIWKRAANFTPPSPSALAWVTRTAYDVVDHDGHRSSSAPV